MSSLRKLYEEARDTARALVKDWVWRPRLPNGSPCIPETHFPVHRVIAELTDEDSEKASAALEEIADDYELDVGALRKSLEWVCVWLEYEHDNLQDVRVADRKAIAEWIRSTSGIWAEGPRQMLDDLAAQIEDGDHEKFHKAIEEQA